MKKQIRGSLWLLLTTVIWGSAFVSQSVGMDHIGPFTFQAARSFLAVIALMPAIWIFDRARGKKNFWKSWLDKKLWKAGLLCGLALFFASNLQQLGLVDTGAGKSAFLTAMYIVLVPIIGLFRKKPFSPMIPISVVLAVCGLYCLTGVSGAIVLSDMLLLGCALMFSVQITFVDIFSPSVDALRLNTVQVFVCSVLSAIIMAFTETPTWQGLTDCALPLAHAGILSMGVAYSTQIIGQKNLEPSTASLIMSLESVFALLFGWLLLGQGMSTWEGIGCVLVFAAVILSQINIKKKAPV